MLALLIKVNKQCCALYLWHSSVHLCCNAAEGAGTGRCCCGCVCGCGCCRGFGVGDRQLHLAGHIGARGCRMDAVVEESGTIACEAQVCGSPFRQCGGSRRKSTRIQRGEITWVGVACVSGGHESCRWQRTSNVHCTCACWRLVCTGSPRVLLTVPPPNTPPPRAQFHFF